MNKSFQFFKINLDYDEFEPQYGANVSIFTLERINEKSLLNGSTPLRPYDSYLKRFEPN